jgi:hypothetical protein
MKTLQYRLKHTLCSRLLLPSLVIFLALAANIDRNKV